MYIVCPARVRGVDADAQHPPALLVNFSRCIVLPVCYDCRMEFAHSACGEVFTRNDCSKSRVSQSVRVDLTLPSNRL